MKSNSPSPRLRRTRVLVAMSGGVDSSTAAFLLKQQGYQVSGVYFRTFEKNNKVEKDVAGIAKFLDIPFQIIDIRKEFKKQIIQSFLDQIKQGVTPNPCIVCNPKIKFKTLFNLSKDYIATGHYAIRKNTHLYKARDITKDQSYFLYRLKKDQLKKILFPLGEYTKEQVKRIAAQNKLPIKQKGESQDVCFIPGKYEDFIRKYIKPKHGKIIDQDKNEVGKHNGLFNYTLGQREGIGIKNGQGPYYVVKKNVKNNILVVSNNNKDLDLHKKIIRLKNVSWVAGVKPCSRKIYEVKVRYSKKGQSAKLLKKENKIYIEFKSPVRAPTPGQHAVLYLNNEVMGGGEIV